MFFFLLVLLEFELLNATRAISCLFLFEGWLLFFNWDCDVMRMLLRLGKLFKKSTMGSYRYNVHYNIPAIQTSFDINNQFEK